MKKIILGIVSLVALVSMILMFQSSGTGQASYQQLLHKDYMVYNEYSVCEKVECGLGMSAIYIGDDKLSGNSLCQCPNGQIYQLDKRGLY